ncbi:YfhO family protein [Agromyces seonyuensis]|uniref:YfhO family protein n=1 Tax=Agromyces seonyuensis TaxID=2662446 RepID=A0A6I4P6I3_9MICO|nr:YfhO family protein [Agromyces seonyuensis]MWB99244.1 YfhO family protein [Agromyces seonyuensis]
MSGPRARRTTDAAEAGEPTTGSSAVVPGPGRSARLSLRVVEIAGWVALAAFAVLSIGLPLVGDGVFLGTQLLTGLAPWQSALADTQGATNPYIGDTIDSGTPQVLLIVDAVRAGGFPDWNPYIGGGTELAGLPNSGLYSPLSLPWWVLPATLAPGFVKLLEIAVVTLGMSLLLRRLGAVRASWPIASLVFASSGFMIAWTNWPQTRVAAFIPLVFWALERAVSRGKAVDVVPVGIAFAAMLLGGFPAVTGYALYAGGAYVVVRAFLAHDRLRDTVRAGIVALGGVVLAVVIAAWQLVPFAVNAMNVLELDAREQQETGHLFLHDLASMIVPDINGGPAIARWGGHPVEHFSYVGAGALVLVAALLLFRGRPRFVRGAVAFFTVALLVAVVLTYVGGPLLAAFQELPIFSNNPVGRLRVLVGFFLAVLAGLGFSRVLTSGERAREFFVPAGAGRAFGLAARMLGLVALAIAAALVTRTAWREVPVEYRSEIIDQAIVVGVAAMAVALVVLLVRFAPAARVAAVVVPIAVAVPATLTAASWWPKSETATFYPETSAHEFLDEHLGDSRYATVEQTMLPGSGSAYGQRTVGGHGFMTQEWKQLVRAVDPDAITTQTYSTFTPGMLESDPESPILDRLAVRYVTADPRFRPPGTLAPVVEASGAGLEWDGEPLVSGVGTGPVRGVAVEIVDGVVSGADGVDLVARLSDADTGEVLAETSTWTSAEIGGERWIALDADGLDPSRQWRLSLELEGADAGVRLATDADGALLLQRVLPAADGLDIVATGDATIYERAGALDRVRWADAEVVETDVEERIAAMASGTVPDDAVVLEDPDDAAGLAGGSTAEIVDESDGADLDVYRYRVEATGEGWLEIAESLRRPGWTATVDGEPVDIVPVDNALGAIRVDAGTHVVELEFRTPGLALGSAVSGAAVVALAVWGIVLLIRRRRRRMTRTGA